MKLKGTHVLVTGGASGLGEACVRRAVAEGAKVSFFDLHEENGKALQKDLGENHVRFFEVDIVEEASSVKGIEGAIAAFGPIRVVLQCAGVANPCRILSSRGTVHPLDQFQRVVGINLVGTFNVLRLVVAHMSKLPPVEGDERGVFVHVASVAAFEGQIGQAAYSASKGGVVAMTLPLARELGALGIRVNTVAPGIFGTPMMKKLPEKAQASLAAQVPFPKRLGAPEEFADCCMHLVQNQYYNGTVVRLDGSIRMSAL